MFLVSKTPFNTDPIDKPKFDLVTNNELNDQWNDQPNEDQTVEPDPNVSVFHLNVRDDRKTRDIENKNQTDTEAIVASVVEITTQKSASEMAATMASTTTSASPSESLVQSTTAATAATSTASTALPIPVTSTSTPTPPTTTSTEIASTTQSGQFQPILNIYYGGAPNEYADYVYFTTSEPAQNLEPSTENPQMASDRNDINKFRPSIQYEYRNYRYDTDNHFVPIVGTKQIF